MIKTDIEAALLALKIPCAIIDTVEGPQVTRFRLLPQNYPYSSQTSPPRKIRVSEVSARVDDIEVALGIRGLRLVQDGALWLEVPKDNPETIYFDTLNPSTELVVPVILGVDQDRKLVELDLADSRSPHLLIAGATGSGKSVCVQSIIASIITHKSPSEVSLAIADPKYELRAWDVEHLITPIVHNVGQITQMLTRIAEEMDARYEGVPPNDGDHIVVVVDEYADLISLGGRDVEYLIARIAQKGRAAGIHLVLATQRPSVDIVTGAIKANFPARIAFAVASAIDSRVILDETGAEKLAGMGDGILKYGLRTVRFKGAFVRDAGALIAAHGHDPWEIQNQAAIETPAIKIDVDNGDTIAKTAGIVGALIGGVFMLTAAPFVGLVSGTKKGLR
jgi:S-DNA-T family DNA segregation ATPase FtsK/SpoIIIE